MAGGEPIPENPLIGSDDFPTAETQKPVISCAEPAQLPLETASTEKIAEDHLEDSTVLVIQPEDQDTIKSFWVLTGVMEDDMAAATAVEITIPEPQEDEASRNPPDTTVAEPTPTEAPAPEASLPTPPPEENMPATETGLGETQPEAELQTPEVTQTPEATETEQTTTPPPAPQAPKIRNQVPIRKTCATCEGHTPPSRCYATSCLACGDNFVLIYEDEQDSEEIRAKLTEAERPACNPGDEGTAYCKTCMLDWFDNSIAWPHRETLPKHEGESVLPLLTPFVSEAYMEKLNEIQAYWDDKEKIFCPVPTCSAYIPRATYTIVKEEIVTRKVEKPAPEKAEEIATTTETNAEPATEIAPEAEAETATTATQPADPATDTTSASNTTVETTTEAAIAETNVAPEVEASKEEKKEELKEELTEVVKKEYKTRLAICRSPTCHTPVCTLCKSHFHGLDTPCESRTNFFKEFMLAKFAKGKNKEGEEGEGTEAEESNENEEEQYEDDEYEEYPNRFRQCVNCQNLVARHTGCDHMTCSCGAAFCFYCGGEYGAYHSCISDDDYKAGEGVGGIKITTEDGFLDDEGATIVVNPLGVVDKEEEAINVAKWLEVVEFTENEEVKKSWKIRPGVTIEGLTKAEPLFSEEEKARLAKPMKDWKGKYY